MTADVRVLLVADSHLGFDLPMRPRIAVRRRGHDFLDNYFAALGPALAGEVDIVVHAGDVFDRPTVAPTIALQAYEPLHRIADRGVPVFIVPGNHERSRLPHPRLASHELVHVFDRPRTFVVDVRGEAVALSGFPYERGNVRARFAQLVSETGWSSARAALRVLCLHHCVEGATVGPGDYVFTTAEDVIRLHDVPREFAAVLSGHIHRHQVLTADRARRPFHAPVLYPGSIERTSLAEQHEVKGFMMVRFAAQRGGGVHWEFRALSARPMVRQEIVVGEMNASQLDASIRAVVATAPRDAVLSIRITGPVTDDHRRVMTAAALRAFAPETMNVDVRPTDGFNRFRRSAKPAGDDAGQAQLSLY